MTHAEKEVRGLLLHGPFRRYRSLLRISYKFCLIIHDIDISIEDGQEQVQIHPASGFF
jgi:hypothetical protein